MNRLCPVGPTLLGIDVSHYQPQVTWNAARAKGVEFVFAKATEGTTSADKMFHAHRSGAKMAGLMVGGYHFFHPKQDAKAQAQFFAKALGLSAPLDLPPVMDWESTDHIPSAIDRANGFVFLTVLESLTKRRPIIYGSPYFLQALGLDARFARFPLWVAHYGTNCPLVPAPWQNWAFHQTSDHFPLPGGGACDGDVFQGSLAQLQAL